MNKLEERLDIVALAKSEANYLEYKNIVADLLKNDMVKEMKFYNHHYTSTCYSHSLEVSYYSFCIAKKLNLDYKAVARAGLLHDLFLYDWKTDKNHGRFHGIYHPAKALKNAMKIYTLSAKEQDIIKKHMWPLTLSFPRYPESYIVTFVDKYCASRESYDYFKDYMKSLILSKKISRYAYLFLAINIIKIL